MSEMDGRHAAELAIIRAQRDALAAVVNQVWDNASDGYESGPDSVETCMVEAGLAEYQTATARDPAHDVEGGDPLIRLSDFGRAALVGARP